MGYVRLQHVTNYQLDLDLIFWALGHFQLLTLDTTTGTFAPCGLVRVTAEFSVNRARSANIKRPETAETRRFDTRKCRDDEKAIGCCKEVGAGLLGVWEPKLASHVGDPIPGCEHPRPKDFFGSHEAGF